MLLTRGENQGYLNTSLIVIHTLSKLQVFYPKMLITINPRSPSSKSEVVPNFIADQDQLAT